jgi:phage-related holin
MARKAAVLILVGAALLLELELGGRMGLSIPLGEAVAGFYAAHELLSIIENSTALGLPVPNVLRQALSKLGGDQGGQAG